MRDPSIRRVVVLTAIVLVVASVARAQSETSIVALEQNHNSWEGARSSASAGGSKSTPKIVVVTTDKPDRRQGCRVQSFDADRIVCSRAFGGPRTYSSQQVAALILPGDGTSDRWMLIGFNGGLGASIWGTVVLAATCPACAVATGIAAFFFFVAAGDVIMAGGRSDQLLYLAPGQKLSRRMGFAAR